LGCSGLGTLAVDKSTPPPLGFLKTLGLKRNVVDPAFKGFNMLSTILKEFFFLPSETIPALNPSKNDLRVWLAIRVLRFTSAGVLQTNFQVTNGVLPNLILITAMVYFLVKICIKLFD
jgi:hypothetical protein